MTVHSLHIFDRRGKTLFTKTYSQAALSAQIPNPASSDNTNNNNNNNPAESAVSAEEQMSEQRKLVFGMLFSLREMVGSLSPIEHKDDNREPVALDSVRTGASTIHNYETASGIRFAMYTSNDVPTTSSSSFSSSSSRGGNNNIGSSGSSHGSGLIGGNSIHGSGSSSHHSTSSSGGTAGGGTGAGGGSGGGPETVQDALRYVYTELWVECVVRSPLYRPGRLGESSLSSDDNNGFDIRSTNFERRLDTYLTSMPWFR